MKPAMVCSKISDNDWAKASPLVPGGGLLLYGRIPEKGGDPPVVQREKISGIFRGNLQSDDLD